MTDRHALVAGAADPRRAGIGHAPVLSRLFAAAFLRDPVFDWIARPGRKRPHALEQFFYWLLISRAIPFGEVWMCEGAAAAWLPPDAPASPGGLIDQMRLLPHFVRLCGIPRLYRGSAMAAAIERNRPARRHSYLAFLAVAPRLQGLGVGSALLDATLRHIDRSGTPAYLENSNPRNARLYERAGFIAKRNIAPAGAPPLIPMWRTARQGSSSLSQ